MSVLTTLPHSLTKGAQPVPTSEQCWLFGKDVVGIELHDISDVSEDDGLQTNGTLFDRHMKEKKSKRNGKGKESSNAELCSVTQQSSLSISLGPSGPRKRSDGNLSDPPEVVQRETTTIPRATSRHKKSSSSRKNTEEEEQQCTISPAPSAAVKLREGLKKVSSTTTTTVYSSSRGGIGGADSESGTADEFLPREKKSKKKRSSSKDAKRYFSDSTVQQKPLDDPNDGSDAEMPSSTALDGFNGTTGSSSWLYTAVEMPLNSFNDSGNFEGKDQKKCHSRSHKRRGSKGGQSNQSTESAEATPVVVGLLGPLPPLGHQSSPGTHALDVPEIHHQLQTSFQANGALCNANPNTSTHHPGGSRTLVSLGALPPIQGNVSPRGRNLKGLGNFEAL